MRFRFIPPLSSPILGRLSRGSAAAGIGARSSLLLSHAGAPESASGQGAAKDGIVLVGIDRRSRRNDDLKKPAGREQR
jgi:hypothetical protein